MAWSRLPAPSGGQRHGDRRGRHQHQHAGGVGAALRVDVRVEDPGDQEGDGGEHQHQRPDRLRPFRCHAVPGEVAGHQVEQPGHRGGAGEPQDGDRRERRRRCRSRCRGTRARGRPAPGRSPRRPAGTPPAGSAAVVMMLEVIRKTLMITAAVVSSRRVPRIRPAGLSSVSPASPRDLRHHRDAGLESGQSQRELREDQQRDADHHPGARVVRWSARSSSPGPGRRAGRCAPIRRRPRRGSAAR